MDMSEWAKQEVEIAIEREKRLADNDPDEYSYGVECYKSALKAFECLMEDGHSGYSINFTKHILMRLIDGNPLVPIEDTPDIWQGVESCNKDYKSYQCKRMSSLFKDVYEDGTVKYSNVNRYYCEDIHSGSTYTNGFIAREIIDKMFPITMPYMSSDRKYKVTTEDILYDTANGDYDTIAVYTVTTPEGDVITLDLFYKESPDGLVQIDHDEFYERKKVHEARKCNK